MFLSLVLDSNMETEDERISIAWNIYHDIYLGEKSLAAIESQSKVLLTLSESMEMWSTSPFGQHFRIINLETLQACREIWKQYHDYATSPTAHRPLLDKVVQTASMYEKHWAYSDTPSVRDGVAVLTMKDRVSILTVSFGLSALKSQEVSLYLMNQYWARGVADPRDMPIEKFLNPMLLYTRSARDKFVVDRNASPLSIYHLREAAESFEKAKTIHDDLAKVLASAKSQFQEWCLAFRELVDSDSEQSASNKLVVRFVAGDPIAFCLAVQQVNSLSDINFRGLSNTWSGTALVIDRDRVPAQFNTIETSTLVDSIGCVNILLATVPILQPGPASTLTTESYDRPYSEETVLLAHFLCQQAQFMYALFGVAPLADLTGVSPMGRFQDTRILLDFSRKRHAPIQTQIVWKSTWSGDSNLTHLPKFSLDTPLETPFHDRPVLPSDDLLHFMVVISVEMLSTLNEMKARADEYGVIYRRHYTPASFAALIGFFKTRISSDVDKVLDEFVGVPDLHDGLEGHLPDLIWQLQLSGAYVSPGSANVQRVRRIPDPSQTAKIFTLTDRPPATCVVLTVPRGRLTAIYNKVFRQAEATCTFEIRLKPSGIGKSSPYASVIPIFGKLVVNDDGLTGRIEADKAHWHGTSDLQVCVYLPTHNLCLPVSKADRTHITFALYKDQGTLDSFKQDYGKELKIFETLLSDTKHVHCLTSVEGFEQAIRPTTISDLASARMIDTDNAKIKTPMLLLREDGDSFATNIIPSNALATREFFRHDPVIAYKKTSPCTITIEYGPISHTVQFPYPVLASKASLNVIKPLFTIELEVPLCDPEAFIGGYYKNFLPLARDNETNTVCSWTLPLVNLANLPLLKDTERTDLMVHTAQMLSDRETTVGTVGVRGSKNLVDFKNALGLMLRDITTPPHTPKVMGITHRGELQYLFFMTDVFMDDASHTIVAEAFFFQLTLEHRAKHAAMPSKSKLDVKTYEVSSKQLQMWKQYVPAMAERCRSWQHKSDCEYTSPEAKLTKLCSCGKGLTSARFNAQTEWIEFAPEVVRCAISPIFPAPFIESARRAILETIKRSLLEANESESVEPEAESCNHCKAQGELKKCAKCSSAFYCNK
jgi:hypothetical protein